MQKLTKINEKVIKLSKHLKELALQLQEKPKDKQLIDLVKSVNEQLKKLKASKSYIPIQQITNTDEITDVLHKILDVEITPTGDYLITSLIITNLTNHIQNDVKIKCSFKQYLFVR